MNQEKLEELFEILKSQDARIDYNFNTLIQTSIIVEFLFEKLQELSPEKDLQEEFAPFQQSRLAELEEIITEAKTSFEEVQSDISNQLDEIKL